MHEGAPHKKPGTWKEHAEEGAENSQVRCHGFDRSTGERHFAQSPKTVSHRNGGGQELKSRWNGVGRIVDAAEEDRERDHATEDWPGCAKLEYERNAQQAKSKVRQ